MLVIKLITDFKESVNSRVSSWALESQDNSSPVAHIEQTMELAEDDQLSVHPGSD